MELKFPFIISSRLLPAIKIGDSTISLEHKSHVNGRGQYVIFIDTPDFSHVDGGLGVRSNGSDYQEAMKALLDFLSASVESYCHGFPRMTYKEDCSFPEKVVEWAYNHSDEIQMIALDLEESSNLISY